MATVTTAVVTGSNVRINWTAPADRNDTITSYTIEVLATDSQYKEDTVNCDGSNAAIMTNLACEIPLSRLQDPTFTGLSQGSLVTVRAKATNAFGSSTYSDVNTVGALIETVPH